MSIAMKSDWTWMMRYFDQSQLSHLQSLPWQEIGQLRQHEWPRLMGDVMEAIAAGVPPRVLAVVTSR